MRLSSGKPLMNAVAADIALFLGSAGLVTDALSKFEAGKALPQVLAGVERFPASVRGPWASRSLALAIGGARLEREYNWKGASEEPPSPFFPTSLCAVWVVQGGIL